LAVRNEWLDWAKERGFDENAENKWLQLNQPTPPLERSRVVVQRQQLKRPFFDRLTVNWHWRLIGLCEDRFIWLWRSLVWLFVLSLVWL
jgi:hypothetical protein